MDLDKLQAFDWGFDYNGSISNTIQLDNANVILAKGRHEAEQLCATSSDVKLNPVAADQRASVLFVESGRGKIYDRRDIYVVQEPRRYRAQLDKERDSDEVYHFQRDNRPRLHKSAEQFDGQRDAHGTYHFDVHTRAAYLYPMEKLDFFWRLLHRSNGLVVEKVSQYSIDRIRATKCSNSQVIGPDQLAFVDKNHRSATGNCRLV